MAMLIIGIEVGDTPEASGDVHEAVMAIRAMSVQHKNEGARKVLEDVANGLNEANAKPDNARLKRWLQWCLGAYRNPVCGP